MSASIKSKMKLDGDRIVSQQFAQTLTAYLDCSDVVQGVIREMSKVYLASDATDEEREAALDTIVEALFPQSHNGQLGMCLEDWESDSPANIQSVLTEMDQEEATFGDRVNRLLELKSLNQADLATAIGVKQPAISMMLSRAARPQRRTVEKIAAALEVTPEEIWPGIK
jgi:lambda repressor-like predicted transcriptional regulator